MNLEFYVHVNCTKLNTLDVLFFGQLVILYNLYILVDINWNIYNEYLCLQNWVGIQPFVSHIDRAKLQVTLMVVEHLAPPEGAENCHIVSSKSEWELLVVQTDGQQQGILLEGHQRAVTCSLSLCALSNLNLSKDVVLSFRKNICWYWYIC